MAALLEEQTERIGALEAEIERLQKAEADGRRQLLVRRLLSEFHLPGPEASDHGARSIVSPRFLETLTNASTDEAVRDLVEERSQLVRGIENGRRRQNPGPGKPRSLDPAQLPAARDARAFLEAIT